MIRNRPNLRRRRGVAAVEFAAVLPLILLLLLGIWDVGRMIEVQQIITNAAREGGRQASTGAKSIATVKQNVKDYIARAGISNANVEVEVENLTSSARLEPPTSNQLDRYKVTVTIPMNDVRWIILGNLANTSHVTGSVEWFSMRDVPLEVTTDVPAG